LTTVVQDRNAVADLWVDVFGARVVNEGENRARRTVSTYVRVGELPGTVLEFAEVRPDGPAALDLGLCPTGILHSITFLVRDIEVIRARLVGSGFDLEFDGDEMIVTDPSSTLGARFGFTTVELA
jgi:catechol 2,3-dioxygenase-like lactoylglutathione lyase family enzyme